MVKTLISILVAALLSGGAAAGTPSTEPTAQPAAPVVSEPAIAAQTQPAEQTEPAIAAQTQPEEQAQPDLITADEAESIALDHAGLSAGEVKGLRSEYDVDDGVKEYEVDFRSGGWEYDYTIHAESGAILSSEKDRDD